MVVNQSRSVVCTGPAKLLSLDYHKTTVDAILDIANECHSYRNSNYTHKYKRYDVHS